MEDADLESIVYEITDGNCSGETKFASAETVDGPAMAKLLIEQGSDPGFFQLSDDGEDA